MLFKILTTVMHGVKVHPPSSILDLDEDDQKRLKGWIETPSDEEIAAYKADASTDQKKPDPGASSAPSGAPDAGDPSNPPPVVYKTLDELQDMSRAEMVAYAKDVLATEGLAGNANQIRAQVAAIIETKTPKAAE